LISHVRAFEENGNLEAALTECKQHINLREAFSAKALEQYAQFYL
jgi:hypothetical protein